MPQFMMLLYDRAGQHQDYAAMSPAEMQRIIEKYGAWSEDLARQGKLHGGEKLRDGTGRVLRGGAGGTQITDGPFTETKEVVGGYFVIEASGYDEATELARSCPHLEFGGTIEVREIEPIMAPTASE